MRLKISANAKIVFVSSRWRTVMRSAKSLIAHANLSTISSNIAEIYLNLFVTTIRQLTNVIERFLVDNSTA